MPRIGQILCESVPLSQHDLEEILQEQKVTRQRFGDAALSLGMVRADQVWDAWLAQLRHEPTDATRGPIDAEAVATLPADVARHYRIAPLRLRGSELVVAASEELSAAAVGLVERRCGRRLIVARAMPGSVERALARHYPSLAVEAA